MNSNESEKQVGKFAEFLRYHGIKPGSPASPSLPSFLLFRGQQNNGVNEEVLRAGWDSLGKAYFSQEPVPAMLATMWMLLEHLNPPKGKERWLSLGSGPGLYEIFLCQRYPIHMTSVDFAKSMLDIQGQVARQSKVLDKMNLVEQSMTSLEGFDDHTFDRIFCINSLHWVDEWRKAVSEIDRTLSNNVGSTVYMVVGSRASINAGQRVPDTSHGLTMKSLLDEIESHPLRISKMGGIRIDRDQVGRASTRLYCLLERNPHDLGSWKDRWNSGQIRDVSYRARENKLLIVETPDLLEMYK